MKKLGLFAALPAAMLLADAASMTAALADEPIVTKAPASERARQDRLRATASRPSFSPPVNWPGTASGSTA